MKEILKAYRHWVDVLGYSQPLVKDSTSQIREFLLYLGENEIELNEVSAKNIDDYYEKLQSRPSQRGGALSQQSLNSHIGSIKRLSLFLVKHGASPLPINIRQYKVDQKVRFEDIVSQSEMKQLYLATEHSHKMMRLRLRDKAILVLLYNCGLRRNEAVHLNRKDILFDKERILVRQGKNYKERFVPINEFSIRILEEYLYDARYKFYNAEATESFLLNHQGGRLGGQTMKTRLREIIKATGNKELQERNITPHKLRHSIATHLLQQGAPLGMISKFLGHTSLESTQIYTHVKNQI